MLQKNPVVSLWDLYVSRLINFIYLMKINTKNIEYDNEKTQKSHMFSLYKYHKDQVLQVP